MSLKAIDVQTALVNALAASSTLAAQCVTYFGIPAIISAGGSGRQGQMEAPCLSVLVWNRSAGQNDVDRSIEASILLSLTDNSITTTTETVVIEEGGEGEDDVTVDVTIETYGGPAKLEALLELAAGVVLALNSELMIADLAYSFEPLEYFPLFVGGLDFTVTYPVLLGGYEPDLSS